jgi:hypothetical protein
MKITIGTCSCCGGEVQVCRDWMAVIPQTPTCARCGAVAALHGPVIPMTPAPTRAQELTTPVAFYYTPRDQFVVQAVVPYA